MLNDFERTPRVGDEVPPQLVTVDLPSMKVFSLIMRDPNPIHFDPELVRELGLGGGAVNQGTLNMAYPINALLSLLDEPAQLRRFRCRFLGSVYEHDVVTSGGIVTAVEGTRVSLDIWLDKQDGTRVLTGSAVLELT
jgi:acyl dehydratase